MAEHTPTPWVVNNDEDIWSLQADGATPDVPLLRADRLYRRWGRDLNNDERAANAAFIVRACNAHYAVVEALQAMVDEFACSDDTCLGPCKQARAALAKARGEA